MSVAVILPALNEEATVGEAVGRVPRDLVRHVIVVDNGSTDGTAAAARRAGARVVREPRRGYGAACLRGLAALPPDVEVVAFLDADLSDDPALLPALAGPILEGRADLVLGVRRPVEGGALTPAQRLGNRLAVGLVRLLFGARYRDLAPFRAVRRGALRALELRDRTWGWTVEMQIKAARLGLRVLEIPLPYRRRAAGRSKISGEVGTALRAGGRILWTVVRERLRPGGLYPPPRTDRRP